MVTRPTNVTIPFANSGSKRTIPTASQIGITDGQASFTDGFPPLNMRQRTLITASISSTTMTVTAISSGPGIVAGLIISGSGVTAGTKVVAQLTGTTGSTGTYTITPSQSVSSSSLTASGVPPSGLDVNGILNIITQHLLLQSAGGRYRFDATLAAAIGGYDVGVVLQSNDGLNEYVNILANNTTNFNTSPSSIGVSWLPYCGTSSRRPVGTIAMFANGVVPNGYLECNGSSVSRTAYADLFGDIGVMYGSADGSSFNLPDYRGYFLRSWSHGSGVDYESASRTNRGDGGAGDLVGTKQASSYLSHSHYQSIPSGYSGSWVGDLVDDYGSQFLPLIMSYYGGNETRPININVMFCIKY